MRLSAWRGHSARPDSLQRGWPNPCRPLGLAAHGPRSAARLAAVGLTREHDAANQRLASCPRAATRLQQPTRYTLSMIPTPRVGFLAGCGAAALAVLAMLALRVAL